MKPENQTKKKIRATALKLFEERSFSDVTLNEICTACGINKHTFYYYFKSKDALLDRHYEIPCTFSTSDISSILNADTYIEQMWLSMKPFLHYPEQSGINVVEQILVKNLLENKGTFTLSEEGKELIRLQLGIIQKAKACGEFCTQIEDKMLLLMGRQIYIATLFMWCTKNGAFHFSDAIHCLFENLFEVAPEHRKYQDFELTGIFE